jgi:hypothetical protein
MLGSTHPACRLGTRVLPAVLDAAHTADDHARINSAHTGCSGHCGVPSTRAAGAAAAVRTRRAVVGAMSFLRSHSLLALAASLIVTATVPTRAANVREHTRLKDAPATAVSEAQATDLTLTVTPAVEQTIQTWVRTSATLNASGKILTAELDVREGALIQIGQRARAFPVSSRTSMNQARVTSVVTRSGRVVVQATLSGPGIDREAPYLLEIVVDRGRFLAVPNAAIIEEGDKQIVYMQHHPGTYMPMEIHTGIQGELYTQVLQGLDPGDEVVTFGSFFVDAEYKLKSGGSAAAGHEHHHH